MQVHTLPREQVPFAFTDFFSWVMTLHSCLFGQAANRRCLDLSECVIVIVIVTAPTLLHISTLSTVHIWGRNERLFFFDANILGSVFHFFFEK